MSSCEFTNASGWSSTYSTNETITGGRVQNTSCLWDTTPGLISFKARRVGSSGDTVTAGIWDITGSASPIAVLGTNTLNEWTTDVGGEVKTFSNSTLLNDTNYAIGLKFTGGDASNKLQVNTGASDITGYFGAIYQSGWSSSVSNHACYFSSGATPTAHTARLPPPPIVLGGL